MDLKFWLLFCLLLPSVVLSDHVESSKSSVSCKDDNGKDVDWFFLYKLPKKYHVHLNEQKYDTDSSGMNYLYITSDSYDTWHTSKSLVNESDSMPARTLSPIFKDASTLLVAYNDEFPNETVFMNGGHTKGVIATDGVTGLWLVHSVPKYPHIPEYKYPSTGAHYGQSFLCITLKATEMQKVGQQLVYNEPHIYYHRIPEQLANRYPHIEHAIRKEWHKKAPYNNLVDLESLAGQKFRSFAKGEHFAQELYEDWVAPSLDVNLLVETWRNGAGNFPSNCSGSEKVYNIAEITEPKTHISFRTTSDHSKWAVSQQTGFKLWRWRIGGGDNWICVGDINRQAHQLQRGGGTVCLKHNKVAEVYRKLIGNYEQCHT